MQESTSRVQMEGDQIQSLDLAGVTYLATFETYRRWHDLLVNCTRPRRRGWVSLTMPFASNGSKKKMGSRVPWVRMYYKFQPTLSHCGQTLVPAGSQRGGPQLEGD